MDLHIIQEIQKHIDPDSTSIVNKYTNIERNEILEKIQKNKPLENQNMKEADLSQLRLEHVHFINCNLSDANFTNTHFLHTTFVNCNLRNTKLYNTNFSECSFYNTDLENVKIQKALMTDILFRDCILDNACIKYTPMHCVLFQNTSLRKMTIISCVFNFCTFEKSECNNVKCRGSNFRTSKCIETLFETPIIKNYSIIPKHFLKVKV